ncbi:MAG TPA: bifunctional diguanylate cyclase/phosphodiesterase [Devosia sp.]|nr:bifunctional diguanylate cyclase/phosphodiesterase [Devosia sp.]
MSRYFMQWDFGRLRHWQSSVGIVVPAVLLLLLMMVLAAGFTVWSTRGIDGRAMQRETTLVARAIDRQIDEVAQIQQSVVVWDDAFTNAALDFNSDWLDANLGVWLYDYYGLDGVAILSARNEPIYTTFRGSAPAPSLVADNWSAIAPIVNELRGRTANTGRRAGPGSIYPFARDLALIGGKPAVVSVMPILPEAPALMPQPGSEFLHVVVDQLDEAFAARLERDYGIAGAFVTDVEPGSDQHAIPLSNRDGKLLAFLAWTPARPGIELLQQTGPALAIAFLIAGVVVVLLVQRLWQSSSLLEAERLSARHDAAHDALTGLANRAQFDAELALHLGAREGKPPIALLLLDLDRFKQVNDTLGHTVGDDVIRAVSQRLRELVGPDDILGRVGGDEFAIIHPCRSGPADALALAGTIVEAMTKPFDTSASEAFVGASIGVAVSSGTNAGPRELNREADIALYEAKAQGRGRAVLYEPAMSARLQDRNIVEAELREALKRPGQFSVAYHPLYDSHTGEIAGAEALARWSHQRLGQISPARFIPIAEGAGLIEPLGEFVLRQACTFGARWPGRRMAVNISPAQLRNPRFPERVFDLLVETAMRPSDLELDITEGILLEHDEPVHAALATLRNAGIRIALDDFGTGYSSLSYLKLYPVDCIKIDRSFVAQIGTGGPSNAIVEAMLTLARALNLDVTAEGVETHEQANVLRAMGCNMMQGFLLAPPASEEVVEAKFRRAHERRRHGVTEIA